MQRFLSLVNREIFACNCYLDAEYNRLWIGALFIRNPSLIGTWVLFHDDKQNEIKLFLDEKVITLQDLTPTQIWLPVSKD